MKNKIDYYLHEKDMPEGREKSFTILNLTDFLSKKENYVKRTVNENKKKENYVNLKTKEEPATKHEVAMKKHIDFLVQQNKKLKRILILVTNDNEKLISHLFDTM